MALLPSTRFLTALLALAVVVLAAPYIDPLTLTTIAPCQESEIAKAVYSWWSTKSSKTTESFYSIYISEYSDIAKSSAMSAADSMAISFINNFQQTMGADDEFRSIIQPLPTEIRSYWISLLDERNGVFAMVLNREDSTGTPTVSTKQYAKAVAVPTPTSLAVVSSSDFMVAASTLPTRGASSTTSATGASSGSSSSTNSKFVPAVLALLFINGVVGVAIWLYYRSKQKKRFKQKQSNEESTEQLRTLETKELLNNSTNSSPVEVATELDAGRDGLPCKDRQDQKPGLDAGRDAVSTAQGSRRVKLDIRHSRVTSGGDSNDEGAHNQSVAERLRVTLFELSATTSRKNSPTDGMQSANILSSDH